MTSNEDARAALDQAQTMLEQCQADIARLDEILPWLQETIGRVHELDEFYRGAGQQHIATVLTDDRAAITPPVANEDSVWEVVVGLDERMMRLLRITTAELTASLDGDCC